MSSACVAPTVVMIWSGAACTLKRRQLVATARGAGRCRPCGSPYCSENSLQRPGAGHLAHRRRHEGRLQPVGREHAHAGLRLVADLVEHAADQRRRVDRRVDARRRQSSGRRPGRDRLAGIARLGRRLHRLARGSRARRSRGSCAPPPGPAPATGRTRPPPWTGSRPAAARIGAPRAGARRAPAAGRGYARRSGPTAARSATGKRLFISMGGRPVYCRLEPVQMSK